MKSKASLVAGLMVFGLLAGVASAGFPQPFPGLSGNNPQNFVGNLGNRDNGVTWNLDTDGDDDVSGNADDGLINTWYKTTDGQVDESGREGTRKLETGESSWGIFSVNVLDLGDAPVPPFSWLSGDKGYDLVGIVYGIHDEHALFESATDYNILSSGIIIDMYAVDAGVDISTLLPSGRTSASTFTGVTDASGAEHVLRLKGQLGFETTLETQIANAYRPAPTTPEWTTYTRVFLDTTSGDTKVDQYSYVSVDTTVGSWAEYFDNDRYFNPDSGESADMFVHTQIADLIDYSGSPADAWNGDSSDPIRGSVTPVPSAALLGLIGLGIVGLKARKQKKADQ